MENLAEVSVPPELQEVFDQLEEQFEKYKDDPEFIQEYKYYLKEYVGRENPLTFAKRLTENWWCKNLFKT